MKVENKLTPDQEAMRMQVVDLELKARYWKAQHDIRHYTLEAERIQPAYEEYLTIQKAKQEKAQQELEDMVKRMNEEAQAKNVEVQ